MFETQGGTRNRTRDLPKKGSAFILSSDMCCMIPTRAQLGNTIRIQHPATERSMLTRWRPISYFFSFFSSLGLAAYCTLIFPSSLGLTSVSECGLPLLRLSRQLRALRRWLTA